MKTKDVIAQVGTFDVENYGDLLFPYILKISFVNLKSICFLLMEGKSLLKKKQRYIPFLNCLKWLRKNSIKQ